MTSHATNAVMGIKLPYDTIKDFAPISQVASLDLILVAHPSFPAKNVQELIALAKTKPGSISYASFGNGSMAHIAGELLNQKAGIKMEHIPYKGGAPALADNLAGHVPLYFAGLGVALPHIQAGSLRAIAVTGNNRNPQLPNVPKIAETNGLSDYEANIFYGMWAPAGTPEAIIQRLNRATLEITASAAYKKKIEADGFAETIGSSPEKMANTIKSEMEILAKVIKEAKIQP
jgi:tripartite-type tricarboxylate transporter receptor subunit TctC